MLVNRGWRGTVFVSFALYARVIFFPLAIDGLVEVLGDVKTVDHPPGVGQSVPAGVVEGLPHVGPVRPHLPALRRGEFLQAFLAGGLIASGRTLGTPAWLALFALAGLFHGYAYGEAIVGAESTPLGAYLATYLGLDDVLLEIEITPNRPDALSVVGVAREVAALFL